MLVPCPKADYLIFDLKLPTVVYFTQNATKDPYLNSIVEISQGYKEFLILTIVEKSDK